MYSHLISARTRRSRMSDRIRFIVQLFNETFNALATSNDVYSVVDVFGRKSFIVSSAASSAVYKTLASESVG